VFSGGVLEKKSTRNACSRWDLKKAVKGCARFGRKKRNSTKEVELADQFFRRPRDWCELRKTTTRYITTKKGREQSRTDKVPSRHEGVRKAMPTTSTRVSKSMSNLNKQGQRRPTLNSGKMRGRNIEVGV